MCFSIWSSDQGYLVMNSCIEYPNDIGINIISIGFIIVSINVEYPHYLVIYISSLFTLVPMQNLSKYNRKCFSGCFWNNSYSTSRIVLVLSGKTFLKLVSL